MKAHRDDSVCLRPGGREKSVKNFCNRDFMISRAYTRLMTKLTLQLLGEPRVSTTDMPDLRLPTKKSLGLLVYLASPPGVPRSRDQLAGLLWGRSAQEQARSSLRQNLARLRKSLGSAKDAIIADAGQIELDPECIDMDTARLEGLLSGSDMSALADAGELIRGEFACGLHLNEELFDEWLSNER